MRLHQLCKLAQSARHDCLEQPVFVIEKEVNEKNTKEFETSFENIENDDSLNNIKTKNSLNNNQNKNNSNNINNNIENNNNENNYILNIENDEIKEKNIKKEEIEEESEKEEEIKEKGIKIINNIIDNKNPDKSKIINKIKENEKNNIISNNSIHIYNNPNSFPLKSLNSLKEDFEEINILPENKKNSNNNNKIIINIITLFEKIIINDEKYLKNKSYFIIEEKEFKKDYFSSHLIYSVIYVNKLNDKKVLCFRRYDNFDKLNNKLKKKFPYVIIPNLPPKNSLVKIMSYNNEFFKSRMILLTFYINFLNNHIILRETKEFKKFINDVEFDENFFNVNENNENNDNNNYNIKNKIYNVINFLGSGIKTRKLNDSEILIKKLYTHYKNIIEKYQILNKNIIFYIKSIKTKGNEYKKISDNLFFIKDSFNNVKDSNKNINDFAIFSEIISKSYLNQIEASEKLNFKLEALINLLLGICNSLDN